MTDRSYKHKSDARKAALKAGHGHGDFDVFAGQDGRYRWRLTRPDEARKVAEGGSKKKKRASVPRGESKLAKVRAEIESTGRGGEVTLARLMEVSGWDRKNVTVAVSIIRNPRRTQDPIPTTFDRKTETVRRTD